MDSDRPNAARDAPLERRVGPYRILRTLGAGATGAVHEALHEDSGHRVALKALEGAQPLALARFKQEFRAMQGLEHPNLVALEALFELDGRWFIVMQLVEGSDWLRWVRVPSQDGRTPRLDSARLVSTLADITRGLQTLHAAGLVHRDLKPSNIRVTPEGEAVLLDFGLVTGWREGLVEGERAVGTVAYVAPEQAAGQAVGPSVDWYALGACLYEALTGRVPFFGDSVVEVLHAKQWRLPPAPSRQMAGVPPMLDELCMALLQPDVEKRASGAAVWQTLPSNDVDVAAAVDHAPGVRVPFAGRAAELEVLEHAFEATLAGQPRQVLVEGESGIGKSALVEEFLAQLYGVHPEAIVLRGRCYENETVPFKGVDGVVDALARALSRLDPAVTRDILPAWAKVLQQMFPVMGTVKELADMSTRGVPAEPGARRAAAIQTLRELLGRLREHAPVVLVVDDLQWSDLESFQIFRAITEHRNAPPVLLVCTCRPANEQSGELQCALQSMRSGGNAELLQMRGLPRAQARELAARLLGARLPPEWLSDIARESQGHPLFIAELVDFAQRGNSAARLGSITLDAVLAERIKGLPADEGRLLRHVALLSSPRAPEVLYAAVGVDATRGLQWMAQLKARRLVRVGAEGRVQCYHDRVRRNVVGQMVEAEVVEVHQALGRALAEQSVQDAAAVGLHLERGGLHELARSWLDRAADDALNNLSFAQAAALYDRCLGLSRKEGDEQDRCRWLTGYGHALGRGGRSAEAARRYQEAAALTTDRELSVRLRVWSAQHLLQSAQVSRGLEVARQVLTELGVHLPRGVAGAMARALLDLLRMALWGLDEDQLLQRQPSTEEALALEALSALTFPVSWTHMMAGTGLITQHLARALSAGDEGHVARAIAQQATLSVIKDAKQLGVARGRYERARELASEPTDVAFVAYMQGSSAFIAMQFDEADQVLDEAETLLVEHCPFEPWLLTNVRMSRSLTWCVAGQHRCLAERVPAWLADADERGDAFTRAALLLSGCGYLSHLVADEPQRLLDAIDHAIAPWPGEPYGLAQHGELNARVAAHVYQGGAGAWHWLMDNERRLRRAFLLKQGMFREALLINRVTAALGALADARPPQVRGLLRSARRDLRSLKRRRTPVAMAFSTLQRAQLEAVEGKAERAADSARAGIEICEQLGIAAAHGGRYLLGVLEGGDAGAARCELALQFVRAQGYQNPLAAMRAIWLPALDSLHR